MNQLRNIEELTNKLKAQSNLKNIMQLHGVKFASDTGRLAKACCFNHNEKTPSLIVDNEKQIYKCFGGGCDAKGDVITFYRQRYNVTFFEAVSMLAQDLSFNLTPFLRPLTPEEQAHNKLIKINEMAAAFLHSFLLSNKKAGVAFNYLTKIRKVSMDSIKKFQLGYVNNINILKLYLERNGVSTMNIQALELDRSDIFNNRIVYPICDAYGRVISFFSRGDGGVKYIGTSAKSPVNTAQRLYNFNNAKRYKTIIGVEGFHDVIMLDQHGIPNAVAMMSASFTEKQIDLCKEHGVEELIICFDGDIAGERALEAFLETPAELTTRIICLSEDEDPDDFVKNKGVEQFQLLLDNAKSIFEFWINKLMDKQSKYSLTKKLEIMRGLYEKLKHIPTHERELVINELSQRFDLSKETANDFIDRINTKNVSLINIEAEKAVLSALLNNNEKSLDIITSILPEAFTLSRHFNLFNIIKQVLLRDVQVNDNLILSIAKSKGITDIDIRTIETIKNVDVLNLQFHIDEICDKYIRRSIQGILNSGLNNTMDLKRSHAEIAEDIIKKVSTVTSTQTLNDNPTTKDQINVVIKELDERKKCKGGIIGLNIGRKFPRLNNLLQGVQKSHVIAIAGLPKTGKSALSENIATEVAYGLQEPTLWINLEMSKIDLTFRNLSILTGINNSRLKASAINNVEQEKLAVVMAQYRKCPFFISGSGGMTISQIVSTCRKFVYREGIKLIVIDYIQLIRADKDSARLPRWEQLGVISQAIHNQIAIDMSVPVIEVCQLNRGALGINKGATQIENSASGDYMGGAFSIVQDADVVMGVKKDKDQKTQLYISYNRHGMDDVYIPLNFQRESLAIQEES